MTQRILAGALIAGLLAGLVAAILQVGILTPLILEAEAFEATGAAPSPGDAPGGAHDEQAAAAAEADPRWRDFGTVATTLVAYAGFGLLLGVGLALAARAGHAPSARAGLLWGLGGFAAVQLAPAVGLPPELPGALAAALPARQAWWALCVAATAGGLGLLAFGRGWGPAALGVALVLTPHLVGAPEPPSRGGLAPPGLALAFALRSLGVAAVGWALLGTLAGALAARPGPALRPARGGA